MTEEQRANLFHPFQSFFDGGTGIGMAIVYRIVQEHGGRLLRRQPARAVAPRSRSSCPRPGRRRPWRPRRPRQAPPGDALMAATTATTAAPSSDRARLLVIDDEASIVDLLTLVLAGEGYQVEAAHSVTEARQHPRPPRLRPRPLRHDDARRQRARPAQGDQVRGDRNDPGRDHDDRLHLHQGGHRRHEARAPTTTSRSRSTWKSSRSSSRRRWSVSSSSKRTSISPRAGAASTRSTTSSAKARECRRSSR